MPERKPGWVVEVDDATFEKEVLERSKTVPVVVDFWAPWCGPCQVLGPVLERLAEEHQGQFVLAKVDVDRAPEVATAFAIASIPAVKAIKGGQLVAQFEGALPESALRTFLEKILPTHADAVVEQAAAAEGTDPARAAVLYRQAIAEDPQSEAAQVGLARTLLVLGDVEEAEGILKNIPDGGENEEETTRLKALVFFRERAATLEPEDLLRRRLTESPDDASALFDVGCRWVLDERYEDALGALLRAAEIDKSLAKGLVREAMVKIFHLVGVRSELADSYRGKLTALLY